MAYVLDVATIAGLFAFAVAMKYERPRAWVVAGVRGLAARYGRPEHTALWEQEQAELWLMARRTRLTDDLRRIERLILHDETRSATRQLGNRLARDQLIASLARIPDLLPGRDRSLVWSAGTVPPLAYDVAATTLAARTRSVEVLEVGGWR